MTESQGSLARIPLKGISGILATGKVIGGTWGNSVRGARFHFEDFGGTACSDQRACGGELLHRATSVNQIIRRHQSLEGGDAFSFQRAGRSEGWVSVG